MILAIVVFITGLFVLGDITEKTKAIYANLFKQEPVRSDNQAVSIPVVRLEQSKGKSSNLQYFVRNDQGTIKTFYSTIECENLFKDNEETCDKITCPIQCGLAIVFDDTFLIEPNMDQVFTALITSEEDMAKSTMRPSLKACTDNPCQNRGAMYDTLKHFTVTIK